MLISSHLLRGCVSSHSAGTGRNALSGLETNRPSAGMLRDVFGRILEAHWLDSGVVFGYTCPFALPFDVSCGESVYCGLDPQLTARPARPSHPYTDPCRWFFGFGASGVRAHQPPQAFGRTPVGSLAHRPANAPWSEPRFFRSHQGTTWRSRPPALQTESFDWLSATRGGVPESKRPESRRKDIPGQQSGLEEISRRSVPIEDFSGTMSLSFRDHGSSRPSTPIEECKDKDMTYSAPMFVTAEFINNDTGEIKSQTVFMGDFPLMTDQGHLHHQRHRARRRLPARPLARACTSTAARQVLRQGALRVQDHPVAGAPGWSSRSTARLRRCPHRPQAQAGCHRPAQGAGAGPPTPDPGALSASTSPSPPPRRRTPPPDRRRAAGHLPQAPSGRAAHEGVRADPAENLYFNPKRYDLAKVGRYKINKKLGLDTDITPGDAHRRGHRRHRRLPSSGCTPGKGADALPRRLPIEADDIDHFGNRRVRSVGELIQNQVRLGLARMERVVRERMTTQDVEAITPQTLINIRPVVASIREFFGTSQLSPVHGPDQPAGRAHPQAPPLGPRAGRSVP